MAILLQLFSLEDLQALTVAQLQELRARITYQHRTPEPHVAATLQVMVHAEFIRLTGRVPRRDLPPHNPRRGLLGQLLYTEDLETLTPMQYSLLEWAAECALVHDPAAVEALHAETHTQYRAWTGQAPAGPDLPRRSRQAMLGPDLAV